jgi:predicted RNA-binding protein with PIN domain
MIIVDTYNLLNVEGVLPAHLAGPDLVELVALIGRSRHAGDRVMLVCDGHMSKSVTSRTTNGREPVQVRFGAVEIVFSGAGTEADDVIEALLAHHSGSNSLIMVSSDRRLTRAAKKVGAQPMSSAAFLRRLALDADRPDRPSIPEFARKTPLDRASLAYWMAEFDLGEPTDEKPGPEERKPETDSRPPSSEPDEPGEQESRLGETTYTEPVLDAMLLRLIQESRLSIDPVDLDMERWLKQHPPESS